MINVQDEKTRRFINTTKKRLGEQNIIGRIKDFLYPHFIMSLKHTK